LLGDSLFFKEGTGGQGLGIYIYIYIWTIPWLAVLRKIKDLGFDLLTVGAQETKELDKEPPLNYRPVLY
jgi:hypothetical protein